MRTAVRALLAFTLALEGFILGVASVTSGHLDVMRGDAAAGIPTADLRVLMAIAIGLTVLAVAGVEGGRWSWGPLKRQARREVDEWREMRRSERTNASDLGSSD